MIQSQRHSYKRNTSCVLSRPSQVALWGGTIGVVSGKQTGATRAKCRQITPSHGCAAYRFAGVCLLP